VTAYFVQGRPLALTDRDFLAEGGEGKVYAQGAWAYKIFHDPKKALPKAKLLELAKLDRPEILGPRLLIEDENGDLAGYAMPLGRGEPLCKFFTESYRAQVGFSTDDAVKLATRMQDVLAWIHAQHCLVVDYNEHNLLVDPNETPLHIDVGAWQTLTHPATALMEHIRDPKMSGLRFTEGTDWFSFSVVVTQLYVGVHPYRGRHKDYKPVAWRQMMEKGISIFNRDVRLPPGARDFAAIPRGHRAWLEGVLEHGERSAPPAPGSLGAPVIAPVPAPSSGKVHLELVEKYPAAIRDVFFDAGARYVVTAVGVFQNQRLLVAGSSGRKFVLLPTQGGPPTWAEWNAQSEILTVQLLNKVQTIATSSFTVANGRLWTTDRTYLRENTIVRFGPNLTLSTRPAAGAVRAARCGDGVLVQPMPGGDRFSLLLKTGGVKTIQIPELAGWRVLAATGRDRLLQVLGRNDNDLQLVTIVLDDSGSIETMSVEPWVDYEVPSLAITAKGVVVRLIETELRIWRDCRHPMVMPDPGLKAGSRLWIDGADVYASEGQNLWRVRTT
jgi:hypothetical protein